MYELNNTTAVFYFSEVGGSNKRGWVMKKTILLVLMAVMIASPCFAQEVETEGIFSVEGTLWGMCTFEYTRDPFSSDVVCESQVGFYQGEIYGYLYGQHGYFHIQEPSCYDFLLVSIAAYSEHNPFGTSFVAIMQPIGIGVFSWHKGQFDWTGETTYIDCGIGIMHKINDNWTPPEVE